MGYEEFGGNVGGCGEQHMKGIGAVGVCRG